MGYDSFTCLSWLLAYHVPDIPASWALLDSYARVENTRQAVRVRVVIYSYRFVVVCSSAYHLAARQLF